MLETDFMRRAAKLLKTSRLSVIAVAMDCGFEDSNYFTRAFRKAMGVSPSEYRRLC